MWNLKTTIYIIIFKKLITSCKRFRSKKTILWFFLGNKTTYNPYSKSKFIDSFELIWTYQVHFWFFPWYLKRHNGCVLGSTWPNNIVQNPHPIVQNPHTAAARAHPSSKVYYFQKTWNLRSKFQRTKNCEGKCLNLKSILFVGMKVSKSINYSCMLCWSCQCTTTVMDNGLEN
jgi:hypothetical protein